MADTSLAGVRVARELDRLMIERGKAQNGGQRQRQRTHQQRNPVWADQSRVEWHYVAPGKPMQNG
ncbi:hypothetical protein ACVIYL_004521 [Bradyrhizobium sp. USDA 3315]